MTTLMNREKLEELFVQLESKLNRSARLCLFGSSPGILLGQPDRQTQDLDVWRNSSSYDASDLKRAMADLGVLWNPMHPPKGGPIYLQVVVPGIVNFPHNLDTAPVYQRGKLTIVMPKPVILSAAKLVRAEEKDLRDICWWMQHASFSLKHLEESGVNRLANPEQREIARRNLVLVRVHTGEG